MSDYPLGSCVGRQVLSMQQEPTAATPPPPPRATGTFCFLLLHSHTPRSQHIPAHTHPTTLWQSLNPRTARQIQQGEPHSPHSPPLPLLQAWTPLTPGSGAIPANSQANLYPIPERLGKSCSPPNPPAT